MKKRYEIRVQVSLMGIEEDGVTPAYWDETIQLTGALDDLALLVASNATNNTVRQMAQRLIATERRGEWTE